MSMKRSKHSAIAVYTAPSNRSEIQGAPWRRPMSANARGNLPSLARTIGTRVFTIRAA